MLSLNKKKRKKIEETIESVVDNTNPFSTFDDFWWEDEMFSERDSVPTVDASKNILEDINKMSDNILRNLRPVGTRTEQETIEDQFIPIDDRTKQELEDDDYHSFESESEDIEIENIDTSSPWDDKKSTAAKPGAIFKLSTDYNKKVKAANFKKENLTTKVKKQNKTKKPYIKKETDEMPKDTETTEILKVLDDIATLEPGKNGQLAAKKISEKYKKTREATARKNRYKLLGEIVRIEKVETDQWEIKVPVSIEKPKRSGKEAAKKIIKKYDKIRWEKTFRKIVDANEKKKKTENINIIEDIKNSAAKKSTWITAKKILLKYKSMKRPKKTYLVNEEDLDTIEYNEPQEDLFREESIAEAANKVLDFENF